MVSSLEKIDRGMHPTLPDTCSLHASNVSMLLKLTQLFQRPVRFIRQIVVGEISQGHGTLFSLLLHQRLLKLSTFRY